MNFTLFGLNADISEQLAFYGAYHSNGWNQLIHVIFVPLIWGTTIVWLAYTPKLFKSAPYWCNFSLIGYALYAVYYALLDFQTAMIVDTFYLGVFLLANNIVFKEKQAALLKNKTGSQAKPSGSSSPSYSAAKWALFLHVFGWWAQVHPGHAILEGRKPALLDSFVQALTLAPLFVWYEAIWFFFPEYQGELRHEMERRVREIQARM